MKRSNGAGSVYKLSGNRRNPWIAVIVLGYDRRSRYPKDGRLLPHQGEGGNRHCALHVHAHQRGCQHHTVRIPKERKKKEIPTFTDLERAKLFKHDRDPIVETILILIYTGMRISELLSLIKANVDIENMLIVGGVKTEAGRDRIIPIHPKIQGYILRRYAEADRYLIEYDKAVGSKKRKTKHTVRSPYRYNYYCELYYATLDRLGIRRLTPHKARHTFFSRLCVNCKDK